jgi:signal transduction histidine kinase
MTKTYRGHGLGLSVVKALIDLLEGSIELKSQSMQGSTFVITIPELVEQTSEYTSSAGNEFLFDDGEIF